MVVRRRRKGPLKPRTASSLKAFGLTVAQWKEMLEVQGGVCWICGKGGKLKHLSVDHDHSIEKATGEIVVRGLLCARCNSALGKFEWSDEVLERLSKYVRQILLTRRLRMGSVVQEDNIDQKEE